MQNETRSQYNAYIQQLARINGVGADSVTSKFAATPQVQQRLETKIQESSAFLQAVNFAGVTEQEGEKLGLMITGPIASTTDTNVQDRATKDPSDLSALRYRCTQTNYDTHIGYAKLDAWAKFPDFQTRITGEILKRIALDRMMIGFNGKTRAATSNPATNPLLQDVNIGWLQKIRAEAPTRWMAGQTTANKINVGPAQAYKNVDAIVYDAVNNLIDPWYREDTQLVAITGRALLADKYFPLVNTTQPPTEQKAAQDLIVSQKRIGNLQAVSVPHFPPSAILITRLDNLSIYYQLGAQRRTVIDAPKRDRIETYQSSNDAFVLEDYGCCALIENITVVP